MQLLLALSGLAIIVGVVLSRTIGKASKYYLKPLPAIILVLLGLGLCLGSMVVNIEPDYVGIVKQNGIVEKNVLPSGINFVNPLSEVVEFDTRIQNDTIYKGDAKDADDTLISNTLDGNTVKIGLVVTYLVDPNRAAGLYQEAGTDFKEKIVQPLSHNILRRNTMVYDAHALKTSNWEDFSGRIDNDLKSEFRKHGLIVAKVSIRKLEANEVQFVPVAVEKEIVKKNIVTPESPSKPLAKKVAAPSVKQLVKVHKNKVKPLAAASVATSSIVKKKAATAVPKKGTYASASKVHSARVDTMYHHKLKEHITSKVSNLKDSANHVAAAQPVINDTIVKPVAQVVENNAAAPKATETEPVPALVSPSPFFVTGDAKTMDSLSFSSMKEFLNMHNSDEKKLEALNSITKINCFTAAQVVSIDNMLGSPETKLEFAKLAYPRTVDRKNYGIVAESLNKKSKRSLDKYIVDLMAKQNGADANVAATTSVQSNENTIPGSNNNNADLKQNIVPGDCQVIDEEHYTLLKKRIVEDKTADANQDFIKSTVEHNCFTSEQVLRIVKLLKSKKAKLDFAKMAYSRTIDRGNYNLVAGTLKLKYRKALDKYIMRLMATVIAEKPVVVPANGDERENVAHAADADKKPVDAILLSSVIEFTEAHYTDNAKLEALDKILSGNYFKSAQVADIVKLFESENAKLEFAKRAYSRTVDKGTYNIVMNSLNSTSQRLLEDYIVGLFASR